jgi:hypothetical protein
MMSVCGLRETHQQGVEEEAEREERAGGALAPRVVVEGHGCRCGRGREGLRFVWARNSVAVSLATEEGCVWEGR